MGKLLIFRPVAHRPRLPRGRHERPSAPRHLAPVDLDQLTPRIADAPTGLAQHERIATAHAAPVPKERRKVKRSRQRALDTLPTGRALLEWWLKLLPGPETKLLRVVASRYPKPINVGELARETKYEVTCKAFRNPLGHLRTLQLVAGRAEVRAAEELFG